MNEQYKKKLEEVIFTTPLALLTIDDKEALDYVEELLPYSVGFEIECDMAKTVALDNNNYTTYVETIKEHSDAFREIPDIMAVDNGTGEQRYRIPFGLRGLICLYNISELLKIKSRLNLGSGIHYHIDMTESYSLLEPLLNANNLQSKWVEETLSELDTWGYAGIYNKRGIQNAPGYKVGTYWLRWQYEFKTAEFRCGEMTFEFDQLLKCMISASKCIRKLKIQLMGEDSYNMFIRNRVKPPIDKAKIIAYIKTRKASAPIKEFENLKAKEAELNRKIAELKIMQVPARPTDKMKAIIEARTKKLGQ